MWRVVVGTVGVVVPVTVSVLDVFGYVAKVEGASMQPVLNPKDQKGMDYVLLNRWQARDYSFKRGEVVSLSSPTNPDQKIIKRIIGLEGDNIRTLSYKNRNIKIPEGHCWVEGDHHGQSLDSNFFGPVALGLINAKASHIVWPPRRWQRLQGIPAGGDRVNGKPVLQPSVNYKSDEDSTSSTQSIHEATDEDDDNIRPRTQNHTNTNRVNQKDTHPVSHKDSKRESAS